MSSITKILQTATWDYFTSRLPDRFIRSPKAVKKVIMTDINVLVQEFWRTSSDGGVGASFFAVHRLLKILQKTFEILEVCFIIISVYATAVSLADKALQTPANPNSRHHNPASNLWERRFPDSSYESYLYALDPWRHPTLSDLDDRTQFKKLFDGYRRMVDQLFYKSKDLGDMLRFLPGIGVQEKMNIQGMADLYRIKPDLLERFIKCAIEPYGKSADSRYRLDGYLSGFLQDRDRSQLYYCDPMLQHISISRHFLSFLDGSNTFGLQS